MSKEHWFRLYEQRLNELEDEGLPPDEAREQAAEWAHETQRNQLEDYADMKRQQRKDEGI